MSQQELVFTIKDGGEVEVEAVGFTGQSCKDASRVFEQALGKVGDSRLKPEYHQQPKVRLGGGGGR